MKTNTTRTVTRGGITLTMFVAALLGCAGLAAPRVAQGSAGQTGADLWAQTCNRCHNFRTPSSHTDAGWDIIMMHMRARGNLTGAETRAILDYMKSAN